MNPIERLTELFTRFPGIGPRQARRFVQYLLVQNSAYRASLADDIKKLGANTFQCKECYRWSVKNGHTDSLCSICGGKNREKSVLCIVEKDADLENVEKSGFRGLYFVLGGTIPLASEEVQKHIRLRELLSRIERDGPKLLLNEVILGLSATTEGDHTRLILQEKLRPISEGFNFKLSSLGRGLSTGSELEYADPDTIASALSSRT
ncbi:MAG: recombination protein RecR [Parcubacteria group bacterium Gr01-1014_56]|nr:MAG: recombination protein RecR [Parcubacteria group bacterium Gr01-1014_56]